MTDRLQDHWDSAYACGAEHVSWYQDEARVSLELITALHLEPGAPMIDVGGGASPLASDLLHRGYGDVTVLDISQQALDTAREGLGAGADAVTWIRADLRTWRPERRYLVWHDRAVLHFLIERADRERYAGLVAEAVAPGGHAIIATFAPDGPERCSGLPVARSSAQELAELLGDPFTLQDARRETHHTPGGTPQAFTWIVARRTGVAAHDDD